MNLYLNYSKIDEIGQFRKLADEQLKRIHLYFGKSSKEYGFGLFRYAELYYDLGKFEKAAELLVEAIPLLSQHCDSNGTVFYELEQSLTIMKEISPDYEFEFPQKAKPPVSLSFNIIPENEISKNFQDSNKEKKYPMPNIEKGEIDEFRNSKHMLNK